MEWSGRVKGMMGRGLKEKKGDKAEKFESWRRTPVHPVSAMRGEIVVKDKADRFEESDAGRGGGQEEVKANRKGL
jgi:hypothetical protein